LKIVIKAIHANALSTLRCLLAALVFIAFYAKMSAFGLTLDTVLVLIAGLTLARFVFVFVFDALAFLLIRARSFVRTFALGACFSILAAVDTVRNGFWAFDTFSGIEPKWCFALALASDGFGVKISFIFAKSAIVLTWAVDTVHKYITLRTEAIFIIKVVFTGALSLIGLLVPVLVCITGKALFAALTRHASIEFGVAFGANITIDKFIVDTGDTDLCCETGGTVLRAREAIFGIWIEVCCALAKSEVRDLVRVLIWSDDENVVGSLR
jgi:hypothetical protein